MLVPLQSHISVRPLTPRKVFVLTEGNRLNFICSHQQAMRPHPRQQTLQRNPCQTSRRPAMIYRQSRRERTPSLSTAGHARSNQNRTMKVRCLLQKACRLRLQQQLVEPRQ